MENARAVLQRKLVDAQHAGRATLTAEELAGIEQMVSELSTAEMLTIYGKLPDGRLFNIDVDPTPGEVGVCEFTVEVAPGDGDRGPNNEWTPMDRVGDGEWDIG